MAWLLGHQPARLVSASRPHNSPWPRKRRNPGAKPGRGAGGHAALTLSFWKECRKFPPSSPSSRGVPGGLLMPLMLFGEFWREQRGGEPQRPNNRPTRRGDKFSGASGLGQGGCCQGGNRIHTHFWKSIYVT